MRTLPNAVELLASSSCSESKFSSIYRIMVNFTINHGKLHDQSGDNQDYIPP